APVRNLRAREELRLPRDPAAVARLAPSGPESTGEMRFHGNIRARRSDGIGMAQTFPLVRRAFESAASLLAPDVCAGCDARIGILRVFCPVCARTLVPAEETREGELGAFAYGGALVSAITSLKYGGRVDRA